MLFLIFKVIKILKNIAIELNAHERDITHIKAQKGSTTEAVGFEFDCNNIHYTYNYASKQLKGE